MQNYSTNAPASYYSSSPPPPVQKKERGAFLTIVMALATIWNLIATFAIVIGGAALDHATQAGQTFGSDGAHHAATRVVAVVALFQIMQMISVMGMWAWKRWAMMGYFLTSIFAIFAVMKMDGSAPTWSIVWLAVVALAVFPRISMFED